MARKTDYGLVDIETDALFKLLPHIVQAADPGGIRTVFAAQATEHNFFKQRMRELPRLQDPYRAAKFSPSDFGESTADYAELILLRKVTNPSAYQESRKTRLISLLPKTLRAEDFEISVLNFLSKTVGAKSYGQYQVATVRELIASAVLRHHIKGTHTSIYTLGRILGFIDLKIAELWSRYAIKYPADPKALKNDGDFATSSEQYPYWPLNKIYDGRTTSLIPRDNGIGTGYFIEEEFQYPPADPSYDPAMIDDGGFEYTVLFEQATENTDSILHYNRVVDGKNPFGNFTGTVASRLKPAIYTLAGGTEYKRAAVVIPAAGDQSATFEALTLGAWANGISLSIFTNPNGTQRIEITGPQSKIKFKSSYFDLVMAVDAQIFPSLFPATPVEQNFSASYLDLDSDPDSLDILEVKNSALGPLFPSVRIDGVAPATNSLVAIAGTGSSLDGEWLVAATLDHDTVALGKGTQPYSFDWSGGGTLTYGREAGEYPWTGSLDGEMEISHPSTHFQMNQAIYDEVLASLRDMLADTKPLSRSIRKEAFGYLLRDSMPYAPVITIPEVILISASGHRYTVYATGEGSPLWESTDTGSHVTVIQRDRTTNTTYQWGITDEGVFYPIPYSGSAETPQESLVFLRVEQGVNAFLFIDDGELIGSLNSPEQAVDTIHSDGTTDESVIGQDYANYVENPLPEVAAYMSDDASSEDQPGENFTFQTSPEDSITVTRMVEDSIGTFLGLSPASASTHYDTAGAFYGDDPRARHCGVIDDGIEPPPSGTDAEEVNGLAYGYPVAFMNYHGKSVWRDRITNEAFVSTYTYACDEDNPLAGATRIDISLASKDGPIDSRSLDGGVEFDGQGMGVTPNGFPFDADEEPLIPWAKYAEKAFTGIQGAVSLTDNSGKCSVTIPLNLDIGVGQRVRLVGSDDHDGMAFVTSLEVAGATHILTLSTDFVEAGQSAEIWFEVVRLQMWENEDALLNIDPKDTFPAYANGTSYRLVDYPPDDPEDTTVLLTGAVGIGGVDTTVEVTRGKFVALEVKGGSPMGCRLTHSSDTGQMDTEAWGGVAMWDGGRDDIAITLVEDGESWEDIGDGVSSLDPINGQAWWRGGDWS